MENIFLDFFDALLCKFQPRFFAKQFLTFVGSQLIIWGISQNHGEVTLSSQEKKVFHNFTLFLEHNAQQQQHQDR